MRALLVHPFNIIPKSWIPYFPQEPLALQYLAAIAEGHEVRILDCIGEFWGQYRRLDGKFHVGASLEQIEAAVRAWRPELVGVTMPFCNQISPANSIIDLVKGLDRGIVTVAGGSAACAEPERTLESNRNLDIVVMGEGELTFRELLDSNAMGLDTIDGIVYRDGHRTVTNRPRQLVANLDGLPFPKRELVPFDIYSMSLFKGPLVRRAKLLLQWLRLNRDWVAIRTTLAQPRAASPGRHAAIVSSRGCPFNCYYCAVRNVWGRSYRQRSAENVLREITMLYEQWGVRTFNFLDDNFNVSNKRVVEICRGIIEQGLDVRLRAASGLYLSPDLDRETLSLMREAGFTDLYFGIESGNQRVLDEVILKRIRLERVDEIARLCREVGIVSGGYFMVGVPGETVETMEDTIRFALSSNLDRARLYTCQPFPGSKLYGDCLKNGWLADDYDPSRALIFGSKPYIKTEDFSPDDVMRLAEKGKAELRKAGKLDQKK